MKGKERIIVTLIAFFLFCFMSVGYATYGANVSVQGQAKFLKNGEVYIDSAVLSGHKNLTNPVNPEVEGKRISFDLDFDVPRTEEGLQDDYYATYTITIVNDTVFNYTFNQSSFIPELNLSNNDGQITYDLSGIQNGEQINSKEAKTLTLTINLIPNNAGNFHVEGETEVNLEEEEGSLLASIPSGITGDLTNTSNRVQIDVSVINSYDSAKAFDLSLSNNNFYLVDGNNNNITTYTIGANTESTFTAYIKVDPNARFASTRQSMNVYFQPTDGVKTSIGVVTVTVTKDATLVDTTPPTISNVVGTQQTAQRRVNVSFNANDNIGIDHSVVEVIKVTNNTEETVQTINIDSAADNTTVNLSEDGNYYFKVTTYDAVGLNATASSTTKEYRWTMTVTINITNGGPNGTYNVNYGANYTNTITANNGYTVPNSVTVTMEGGNPNYTYNNGSLTIRNVTGDVTVTGTAPQNTCLIEGTKILLANNKTKNVEDIKYDDLLLVWNYETGKVTKEYPVWIEKEKKTDSYTKITFSDKSTINIKGNHSFFSSDINKFVSVNDKENFHIGTNILKINKSKKLKQVKVTKIETINKKAKYYFIASTRYYNVISNNFITTDGFTEITNLYPFDNKISWSKDRKIKEIEYSYLEDVLPYYMYKGFRAGELAILLDNKMTNIDDFKGYISNLIVDDNMLKKPITINNNRYWPVSISNKKRLIKEGDYYTLPKGKWYSTSENITYKNKDKVQVWTGMHFEKVK